LGSSVPAGSKRSRTVKLSLSVSESSSQGCGTDLWILPPSVPTLESWTESLGAAESISSAEASHARTSPSPATKSESTANEVGSGRRCTDSFAKFDPSTSSWRTSQLSLTGGWTEFSGTFTRAGSMRSGLLFQLAQWVPHTCEKGCSLYPTPVACEVQAGRNRNGKHQRHIIDVIDGRPHPELVEQLMGFPIGWTVLPPLETLSFPKSQSGSGVES
jgi:hypothetical protein